MNELVPGNLQGHHGEEMNTKIFLKKTPNSPSSTLASGVHIVVIFPSISVECGLI
jgi:hypothetical protein